MPPPAATPRPFPRVPAYAWTWLQRSRPVLAEAARRLTGQQPTPGFVEDLRGQIDRDPFTRDVLLGVIVDVAFSGRLPTQRPAGTSWDRGLVWWAAAIAGTTPADFEARSGAAPAQQRPLFGQEASDAHQQGSPPQATPARRVVSAERAMVVRALRELLAQAEGDQIPTSAVRQMLGQFEHD